MNKNESIAVQFESANDNQPLTIQAGFIVKYFSYMILSNDRYDLGSDRSLLKNNRIRFPIRLST